MKKLQILVILFLISIMSFSQNTFFGIKLESYNYNLCTNTNILGFEFGTYNEKMSVVFGISPGISNWNETLILIPSIESAKLIKITDKSFCIVGIRADFIITEKIDTYTYENYSVKYFYKNYLSEGFTPIIGLGYKQVLVKLSKRGLTVGVLLEN